MTVPLAALTVVVVDVETTGITPCQDEITEIGAVRLTGGRLTGEFSSLIRPAGPIPADITTLTGITDEMVSRAPEPCAALRAFLSFAGLPGGRDRVLVAHNARFDVGFLTAASAACGIGWPRVPVLDTAILARMLLRPEDVPDYRLATLARYFGVAALPCHRALADARSAAAVLTALLAVAAGSRPALAEAPAGPAASRPALTRPTSSSAA